MRPLLIAFGNPLRGDDGVAHALARFWDADVRQLVQLTPEIAADLEGYPLVIFADADAGATEPRLEPLNESLSTSPLSHFSTPAEVVALARALFGFTGRALLCRIPARDFSSSAELSERAQALAAQSAALLGLPSASVELDARQ